MKTIVIGDYDHIVEAFSTLKSKKDVDVVYWYSSVELIKVKVRKLFPGAVIHDFYDAVRGIPPDELKTMPIMVLDQDILTQYARCECMVIKMMDVMGAMKDFLYQERIRLYHTLLAYSLSVIDYLSPDFVFFGVGTPCTGFDYVLFEICRKKGIPTLFFEKTNIPGLIYPVKDGLDVLGFPPAIALYREAIRGNRLELSDTFYAMISKYIDTVSGDYANGMPVHTRVRINRSKNKAHVTLPFLINIIYNFVFNTSRRNYLKLSDKNIEEYPNSFFEDFRADRIKTKQTKKLKNHYNRLARKPDLSKPYIFVALQNQPENSTSPKGGFFVHQLLMIKLIATCLPKNWHIYVKEHITQFLPFKVPNRSKSKTFYDDIHAIENVFIISLEHTSFELIDNCMATACVTGSVGFESVVRGKPSLVFGNAWFCGCEGIFYVSTYEECKSAIEKIADGYTVDPQLVRLFFHAFGSVGMRGYCEPIYKEVSELTDSEVAASFRETIEKMMFIECLPSG